MRPLRSFLFIPGDSEKKLGKADDCRADALILDLEDSVASERKSIARDMVRGFLLERSRDVRTSQLWVRINPLDGPQALDDLSAIVGGAPDGIMLPKVAGPHAVERVSHYLDALERTLGVDGGQIQVLPVCTETPKSCFNLGGYGEMVLSRLYGMTWGAEDLSAAIGASTNVDELGHWAHTYRMVRSLTLLGAHAAGVHAVETLYVDFRDTEGLGASCRAARSEGFSGRIAIHPAQIDTINASFSPSVDEVAFATRVVEAFTASPGIGTIGLEGKMLDIPHLKQAEKTLAFHEALSH